MLLDKVFGHLELVEKDYFGLQFVDLSPAPDGMISHAHHPVGPYAMVCGFFMKQNFNLHFEKCYKISYMYDRFLCTFILCVLLSSLINDIFSFLLTEMA